MRCGAVRSTHGAAATIVCVTHFEGEYVKCTGVSGPSKTGKEPIRGVRLINIAGVAFRCTSRRSLGKHRTSNCTFVRAREDQPSPDPARCFDCSSTRLLLRSGLVNCCQVVGLFRKCSAAAAGCPRILSGDTARAVSVTGATGALEHAGDHRKRGIQRAPRATALAELPAAAARRRQCACKLSVLRTGSVPQLTPRPPRAAPAAESAQGPLVACGVRS